MTELPFDPGKLPDPKFRAPDLVGAVEGWRVWSMSMDIAGFEVPKLYSATHTTFWPARRAMHAECRYCGDDVPGESCSCGLYSAKTVEHLLSMYYHPYDIDTGSVRVLGQVANWGKVIEGTQGWRAEWAYPVRLWLPYTASKHLKVLKETYGVPVGLRNWLKPAPMGGRLM